jgi:zinc transporter
MTATATPSAISFQSDISGLICGFRFEPGQPGVALESSEIAEALERTVADSPDGDDGAFIWLHFNLSRAGCMRWLQNHLDLPEPFLDMLGEEAHSTRIEQQHGALVAVFNDVIFDFERTPSEVATQWVYAHRRLLVTLRRKPLHSVDRLRESVRTGETFRSPADLMGHLMCDQADLMTQIVRTTGIEIDRAEDRFLASKASSGRKELASTRRVLVRLQRMLAPEPGSVFRLLARPPAWLHPDDVRQLRESTEEFSVVLRDMAGLIERIKLLQEEVIARLEEQNNRTLFTLTLVTVLALPINIVAGLFGMNVGGVPLAENHHGFWVMVGLVAAFTVVVAWWVVRRRNNQ